MKKSLHDRVLAVKDRFIQHLWNTTTIPGSPIQNTLSKDECNLMDAILELEEETKELEATP